MIDNLIEEFELNNQITSLQKEKVDVKKLANENRIKTVKLKDYPEAVNYYEKEFEKCALRLQAIDKEITFFKDVLVWRNVLQDDEKLIKHMPVKYIPFLFPKLKNLKNFGMLDEGIIQNVKGMLDESFMKHFKGLPGFSNFFKKKSDIIRVPGDKKHIDDPFYQELNTEYKKLKKERNDINKETSELEKIQQKGNNLKEIQDRLFKLNILSDQNIEKMKELRKLLQWYFIVKKDPNRIKDVPNNLVTKMSSKLYKADKNFGIFEHLKTYEEYNLYDNYLYDSNNVKEILSNYNLKYEIIDNNPILTIVFPYAEATYGGQWVDDEYKLVLSFLKELSRYQYNYKVNETETTTTVTITFNV